MQQQATNYPERRQAVLDSHKQAEKTRGSGWHPADPGAERREQRRELPLSERPVALLDDDRVVLCGECVGRVVEAVTGWLPKAERAAAKQGAGARADLLHAVKCVKRLLNLPAGDEVSLPTQDWNGVNFALGEAGVQVVLADAVPDTDEG